MNNINAAQRLIPVKEAAKRLNVDHSTLSHWAVNGKLIPDYVTETRHKFYKSKSISRFLKRKRDKKYRLKQREKRVLNNKNSIREFIKNSKKEFIETNNFIVNCKLYNDYYVAQYDRNFKFLGIFENRNQAVKFHFYKKGFRNKNLIMKYIKYNCSLRSAMSTCSAWFGHYYKYIRKDQCVGMTPIAHIMSEKTWGKPKIAVKIDNNGQITQFSSLHKAANSVNVNYTKLCYWLNRDKVIPNTQIKAYTI